MAPPPGRKRHAMVPTVTSESLHAPSGAALPPANHHQKKLGISLSLQITQEQLSRMYNKRGAGILPAPCNSNCADHEFTHGSLTTQMRNRPIQSTMSAQPRQASVPTCTFQWCASRHSPRRIRTHERPTMHSKPGHADWRGQSHRIHVDENAKEPCNMRHCQRVRWWAMREADAVTTSRVHTRLVKKFCCSEFSPQGFSQVSAESSR